MTEQKLKIEYIDPGFCRINYSIRLKGVKCRFCIQEEFNDLFAMYTSTPDWEPDSPVTLKDPSIIEIPVGDSQLEKGVKRFVEQLIENKKS